MMSRRPPSDAFTRFTSTTPHASQKPASSFSYQPLSGQPSSRRASPVSFGTSGPDGETPAQKVARLRAAARAAKERAAMSPMDRIIDRGRSIADHLHRITTYGLIGLAGISTVIAVYGVTSLITYNRRQKRAWIDREMEKLQNARQAFLRGNATAEQLHLLEQERAGDEMAANAKRERERKKSEGYWAQLKGLVGKGAAVGEMGREEPAEIEARKVRRGVREKLLDDGWIEGEVRPVAVAPSGIQGVGLDAKGRPVPANKMERVVRNVEGEVTASTGGVTGGPLDVVANAATAESRGWSSWFWGRKS